MPKWSWTWIAIVMMNVSLASDNWLMVSLFSVCFVILLWDWMRDA